MLKNLAAFAAVTAALFSLGYWLGQERAARAFADRVFELRTYTAAEGKLEALHARFRDHTTKLFEKNGMQNIGYWSPTDAPLSQNTLIYIIAHKDREAAKKSWDAFRADPEWKKAQSASEAGGKLVTKVDAVYMLPTDYSKLK